MIEAKDFLRNVNMVQGLISGIAKALVDQPEALLPEAEKKSIVAEKFF